MSANSPSILLTGATGYVGGRLLPILESHDLRVRCIARQPEFLLERVGAQTEVVPGDVLDLDSLRFAMQKIDTAYYLVHSMGSTGSFEDQDRIAAKNFADAAREAGVKSIVYLGGLGDDDEQLSAHLRSRHEVGELLRESGCVVVEFRASIVIGSGSLSFRTRARPGAEIASDDLSQVGQCANAADRDRRLAGILACRAGLGGKREPCL